MNEEDMPTLRLSHAYRKMLRDKESEKDVREYVKERGTSRRSNCLRNIEQRKNTIVRTLRSDRSAAAGFSGAGRAGLAADDDQGSGRGDQGASVDGEPGRWPNKYVHTSQGVYELRFFFSTRV